MRWSCPVDDCDWAHEESMEAIEPVTLSIRSGEEVGDAINREVRRRVLAREAVMREHAETHDVVDFVQTIARLRRRLACAGDRTENEGLGTATAIFGQETHA